MSEASAAAIAPVRRRRWWPRAPIGVQLVVLLVVSLFPAQALSFGAILLIPPPRPPVYRVPEVAQALHGGALQPHFGRPLIRTTTRTLPAELVAPHQAHERTLLALARTLGAPAAKVRLEEQNASPLWRLRRAVTGQPLPRGRDRGGPMGASPFEADRDPPVPGDAGQAADSLDAGGRDALQAGSPPAAGSRDPNAPRPWRGRRRFLGGPDLAIFGDFSAALQQDDGSWTVVRSMPEPFPSAWQMQASAWLLGGGLACIRDEGQPRRREKLDLLSLIECVADDAALVGGQVEIVDGAPVTVDGDPVALQRLFSNLVDNALKYGGEAQIHVRQDGPAAVVEIVDPGPGLSDEELVRVFQPFYRTDASRNLDNGGVGLGLPIARSTARAHGGDVELTSQPGATRAIVTLPAAA